MEILNRTRIYYLKNSLKLPILSWLRSMGGELQTENIKSEMQKATKFKNLYYFDFFKKDFERSVFDITFTIPESNIKFTKSIEFSRIYCVFRQKIFEIQNHEFLKLKTESKSFIFFTDLDDTLFGNETYLEEFYEYWIKNCLFDSKKSLIYATGRTYPSFCNIENVMEIFYPQYLICSNGAEIYQYDSNTNEYNLDQEWDKNIMVNWNSDIVLLEFKKITWLSDSCKTFHDSKGLRLCAYIDDINNNRKELDETIKRLDEQNIFISVFYSGSSNKKMVDVHSRRAGKGNASLYLMNKLQFKKEESFGFGDSNNDLDLIKKCGKGVLVGNSQKDLIEYYSNNKNFEENIVISEFNYAKALLEEVKTICDI